ncbi:circularly permuted type 2 ATP-grasp protein [Adlercreutzia sp. ZJ242]|uniref:circularly permuted type 2 ATP-grasp protein n=1 Tax=Adlercreutzia sp. ZJ242 TaxID=2709409 RepID=UPI0013ED1DBE|nr:circularly permuted type 2 ATP-grasp protein [Adlercreutzia sp. ZJ242]
MTKNADYTREYFQIIDELDGDVPSRRAAHAYMRGSTAIVHHRVVDCSFVPRLFNQQTYDAMKGTAETAHRILCKVMQRYLDDPDYRRVFDFDERLEELILLPRGYDSLLPFARVDTFLDEDDYRVKFCEFNGDGSSGMNENREITNSVRDTAAFRAFADRHSVRGCDLFEPWVEAFLRIYATYEHRVEKPRVAICDYLENGVVDEFYLFANLFADHGVECAVADVRELTFDGEVLRDAGGARVDAIWRRCVTNDVIDHWDESQALIDAVRAEKVALIGSFAGHIVHDKQIFEVLFKPETCAFLTADEISFIEQTVPLTAFLSDDAVNVAQIRANKEEWIIKPSDHYGADHVYAGCEVSQSEWERLVDEFANARAGYPFIVQRYIRPFKTETLPPDARIEEAPDADVRREPALYNNLNGLYLYDGAFTGVFSRLGPLPTISKENQGMTAATIWVDVDMEGGVEL